MKNTERLNSIDFIKGIAILSVIIQHNMPLNDIYYIAWIGQAVPLFLLVTAYLTFLSFENGKTISLYYSKPSFLKMITRIFFPFFLITVIQTVIYMLVFPDYSFHKAIVEGGIGPGAYYPWIYLQCWLILPIIISIVNSFSTRVSFTIFLVTSISLELICCISDINSYIYRLSVFRYIFLLYLGCLLIKEKITINICLLTLGITSLVFALIETNSTINFEPFLINQWKGFHWITSFYSILVLLFLVKIANNIQGTKISKFIVLLGNYSYEIFLCQMFVYSFINWDRFKATTCEYIPDIESKAIVYFLFILTTTLLSITPIVIYKIHLKKLFFRKKRIS